MKARGPDGKFIQTEPSITWNCLMCGKEKTIYPSRKNKYAGKYCSRECFEESTRGTPRPYRQNRTYFNCEVCGVEFYRRPSQLSRGPARFCSKACSGKWFSGEHHHGYKHGLCMGRYEPEMHQWQLAVKERDHHECVECGATTKELHAHHIFGRSAYPELRHEVWNGVTLCHECHAVEHPGLEQIILRRGKNEGVTDLASGNVI